MTSQTPSEEQKRRFLTVELVAEELNVGLPYLSRAYKATAERIPAGDIADEDGVE